MTAVTGTKPHPIFLAGRWVESPDPLVVANPADNSTPAGSTFNATPEQYEEAVQAAVAAFEVTRELPAYERGRILREISAGLKARREELGRLIALESGKPVRDALVEVDRATLTFRLGAEEAERIFGETIPLDLMPASRGRVGITRRFPIGPIAGISPFNFPLNLAAHKVAPAIASGNPIVLKPPSKDPLTMLTVAEIIESAGVPAGMVSILPMTRELGDRMVADDRFKLLTFTGSPSVGWRMKERAGKKKVVLELGGNAGAIVDATADLDWAAKRMVIGAFSYAGQICISVQRLFVHDSVYEPFMERFIAAATALKLGDPLDPATDVGPMVDANAVGRTKRWVDEAVALGGELLLGGEPERPVLPADDPDRRPADRPGLLERGVRATRRRRALHRLRRRRACRQRLDVRPPDRGLHERPGQRLVRVRAARGRRRDRQRRPDLPDRPHAVRRREGLGAWPRGSALGHRGHDGDPDHGARPARLTASPARAGAGQGHFFPVCNFPASRPGSRIGQAAQPPADPSDAGKSHHRKG